MRGADLRDVHLEPGVPADERSRSAGVVEMDVREQEVVEVGQLEPTLRQPLLEGGDACRRPAVVEREAVVRLDQVHADDTLIALVVKVHRIRRRHAPDPSGPGPRARDSQKALRTFCD